ncbi:DUF3307 domain-containing protein [Nocardiopsis alba]|uniref:DUF3307 domain-containing protein n=1 Tax=Nocardiopsis alba TaxID=53437 RepID=UPI00366B68EC
MIGTVFVALLAGHWIGDHWAQTDHQARTKGDPARAGKRACAAHVGTLTLCQIVAVAMVATYGDIRIAALNLVLGLALNAISHYWCDRRSTLEGVAFALHRIGKHDYYRSGGAPALDQAFHMLFLLLSATIISAPTTTALIGATTATIGVLVGAGFLSKIGHDLKPQIDSCERPSLP